MQQIGSAPWLFNVEFLEDDGQDLVYGMIGLEELPDARANRIQTEIDTGLEIEEDGFAGEFFEEDVFRDPRLGDQGYRGL